MSKKAAQQLGLQFDDNHLVPMLFGECGAHLSRIEEMLEVQIHAKGNEVVITGEHKNIQHARKVLEELWERISNGLEVGLDEVDAAIRIVDSALDPETRKMARESFRKPKLKVQQSKDTANGKKAASYKLTARTPAQAAYLEAMDKHRMVFGVGPAGTGKTYLAVAFAAAMLLKGEVERIILCRPAVEAGENLGFLPGDLKEKVDPYLRPLYDALHDMMPPEQIVQRLARGDIEIAPLAFMRGRTLAKACVILDEAQNTTAAQMKMILTRIGEGSHMIITGDPSQTDLPDRIRSGLDEAMRVLQDVEEVKYIRFSEDDVVRDPLVAKIVKAYEWHDKKKNIDK